MHGRCRRVRQSDGWPTHTHIIGKQEYRWSWMGCLSLGARMARVLDRAREGVVGVMIAAVGTRAATKRSMTRHQQVATRRNEASTRNNKGTQTGLRKRKRRTLPASHHRPRREKRTRPRRENPPGSRSQNDDSTAQAALASSEKETETQRMLQEQVQMHGNLHQSQAKIKVVGLNESAEV